MPFKFEGYEEKPSSGNFVFEGYQEAEKKESPPKKQEPATFKGSAKAYGSGFAGGAGGLVPDVAQAAKFIAPVSETASAINQFLDLLGAQGTHQLTQSISPEGPQNALERILEQSGQFGGAESLVGTAVGGPIGAGVGAIHGSASGALYGGLKELGVDDSVALGITTLATLSPVAFEKLLPKLVKKFKKGGSFVDSLKMAAKETEPGFKRAPGEPPAPPPGGAPPIGPGSVIPQAKPNFESKEEVIRQLHKAPEGKELPIDKTVANIKFESPSLQGRVSTAQELGEVVSKEPFESEAQAGRNISKEVVDARNAERDVVREKYKKAEEVTSTHEDVYPVLAHQNEERIARLESLEKRSAGEEAVYQDALALKKMIGDQYGLIEANADRLMKQANSFSQKVNYELPYAGYKGEIKSIVREINEAVIKSLEKSGKNAGAVREADKTFSRFADRFMGDEISPFLQRKILDPEKLARRASSDEAVHRAVKDAIGSRKTPIVNKIDREVVHSMMDKYYKDPSKVNSKEYVKDLKNLAERIGKEKVAEVDHFLRQRQLNHERKSFLENRVKEANAKKSPSARSLKYPEPIAKTPEQLDKLFTSRSTIRKLKKEMKEKGLSKDFDKLAEQKIEDIFREGGFGARKITGEDLKRIIDKNHEVLAELMGEQELSVLFKAASKAGDKELTQDIIKQVAKSAGKIILHATGLGKIVKLLPLNRI